MKEATDVLKIVGMILLALFVLAVGVPLIGSGSLLAKIFGFLALVMASVNIFGGFLVTRRMLEMFRKKDKKAAPAEAPK